MPRGADTDFLNRMTRDAGGLLQTLAVFVLMAILVFLAAPAWARVITSDARHGPAYRLSGVERKIRLHRQQLKDGSPICADSVHGACERSPDQFFPFFVR